MTHTGDMEPLYKKIEAAVMESGSFIAGFADLSELKGMPSGDATVFEFPYAVTFAVEIPKDAARASMEKPSEEIRSAYKMCNRKLKEAGEKVVQILTDEGYKARFIDTSQRIDPGNLLGPISQKAIAARSGMGWIGKSGLFMTDQHGPRQRMGAVLTNMPVTRKAELVDSKCGECTECIVDRCALKILKETDFGHHPESRDDVMDWKKCGEFEAKLIGDGSRPERACGRCIAVCPLSGLSG